MSVLMNPAPAGRLHFEDTDDEWTHGGGVLFLAVLFGFWLTKVPLLPGWAMASRARRAAMEGRP